jgi:hypothetical protein
MVLRALASALIGCTLLAACAPAEPHADHHPTASG